MAAAADSVIDLLRNQMLLTMTVVHPRARMLSDAKMFRRPDEDSGSEEASGNARAPGGEKDHSDAHSVAGPPEGESALEIVGPDGF